MALSVAQKLGLWRWLSDALRALREDGLLPEAETEMPPGARVPVMYGGKHAGWVNMPKPSQPSATVTSPARLLAWALAQYPEKIEYVPEVVMDAGLIEFLQEHRPESLRVTERVDPQWVADLCHALSGDGGYITSTGERLTDVPGIEVPDARPPVPRVSLSADAATVIGAAWPEIQGELRGLLALPAGGTAPEVADAA